MELYDLCTKYDVLLLEEHWLLPNELSCLNNIHPDFLAFGQSAVDLANGILVGRDPMVGQLSCIVSLLVTVLLDYIQLIIE